MWTFWALKLPLLPCISIALLHFDKLLPQLLKRCYFVYLFPTSVPSCYQGLWWTALHWTSTASLPGTQLDPIGGFQWPFGEVGLQTSNHSELWDTVCFTKFCEIDGSIQCSEDFRSVPPMVFYCDIHVKSSGLYWVYNTLGLQRRLQLGLGVAVPGPSRILRSESRGAKFDTVEMVHQTGKLQGPGFSAWCGMIVIKRITRFDQSYYEPIWNDYSFLVIEFYYWRRKKQRFECKSHHQAAAGLGLPYVSPDFVDHLALGIALLSTSSWETPNAPGALVLGQDMT